MTPDLKLLETILSKVHPNCISDVCEDEGCSLLLEGLVATEYALLSMDGPHSPVLVGMAKCDFLFFGRIPGSDWFCVSPIELTMGIHKSSTDILDQLRAGANLVEDLVPEDQEIQLAPVAAGPFGKYRRLEFRKPENSISFRDRPYYANPVECGSGLLDALEEGADG